MVGSTYVIDGRQPLCAKSVISTTGMVPPPAPASASFTVMQEPATRISVSQTTNQTKQSSVAANPAKRLPMLKQQKFLTRVGFEPTPFRTANQNPEDGALDRSAILPCLLLKWEGKTRPR